MVNKYIDKEYDNTLIGYYMKQLKQYNVFDGFSFWSAAWLLSRHGNIKINYATQHIQTNLSPIFIPGRRRAGADIAVSVSRQILFDINPVSSSIVIVPVEH